MKFKMETQNKKPRDYQEAISTEAADIMAAHGAVYLAMQVRTGKTITALMAASKYGARRVLFVSKLKALDSIRFDYSDVLNGQAIEGYKLEVTNYESLHKLEPVEYDVLILDEAHGLGQYPKPSQRAERIREICARQAKRPAVIYLSGTPTPESYAQMFHQFWASAGGPWGNYKTFYQWHKDYGKPAERWLGQRKVAVYDDVPAGPVMDAVKPYLITWTQEEAGFECVVREQVETVPMPAIIRQCVIVKTWAIMLDVKYFHLFFRCAESRYFLFISYFLLVIPIYTIVIVFNTWIRVKFFCTKCLNWNLIHLHYLCVVIVPIYLQCSITK